MERIDGTSSCNMGTNSPPARCAERKWITLIKIARIYSTISSDRLHTHKRAGVRVNGALRVCENAYRIAPIRKS